MERFELAQLYEEFRDCSDEEIVCDGLLDETLEMARIDAEAGDELSKRLVIQLSLEQPVDVTRANVLALLEPAYSEYKKELGRLSHIEKELKKRLRTLFSERGFEQRQEGNFVRREKNALVGVRCVLDSSVTDDGLYILSPNLRAARARLHRGNVRFFSFENGRIRRKTIPADEAELFELHTFGVSREDYKERFIPAPMYSFDLDEKGGVTPGEGTEYTRPANSAQEIIEQTLLCAGAACDSAEGRKPSKEYLEFADELTGEPLKKLGRGMRIKRVISCFAAGLAFGTLLTLAFILLARIEGDPLGSLAWKIFAFSSAAFALALLPIMLLANYREKNMMLK